MSTTAPIEDDRTHERAVAMRAITQDRYGDADVLRLGTIGLPAIEPDEVLIEVVAAGVDRGVWHLVTGLPYLVRLAGYGVRRPKHPVPGLDVAGRVVAVGDDVLRFEPGDDVFGIAAGSYAEYAAAKADKLVHRPAGVDADAAAVSAVSGITALQALTDIGQVEAGQRVLVVGASGGVGTFAVQIAVALGAEVTGVASAAKLDMVRALGAADVVDYTTEDFAAEANRYDLIVDIGGRSSIRRLRRALATRGTLVIVGGEDGGRWTGGVGRQLRAAMLSPFVRQRLVMFVSKEHHSFMQRLAELLESGAVVPQIDRRVSLAEVPTAIAQLAAGEIAGKAVVEVRGGVR